jgi:Copper transport outer membrane protein, MctB
MGYSGRYHAASLAAVFLALAVGILIGVGFGSDIVSGTADDLEQSLEADLDEKEAEIDALQAQLEIEREFDDAVYPAVVANELRGERIALMALGALDAGIAGDVEDAIGPAGGTLAEVAVVRAPLDLEALAGTVEGREARAIERGDPEALRLYGERAGRILDRGGPGFDELRGTLLSRYSGQPGEIEGAVVVRSRPTELEPDEQEATDALEQGLIAGLSGAATAVGAEASGADPSSIGFFDAEGLPTVDSIDLISGRVALVFALTGSADGNFGVKETADSLLPDLLAPDGGEGGTGGDPEAQGG